MIQRLFFSFVFLLTGIGCTQSHEQQRKYIDLTYAFDEQTIYWPTAEGFVLEHGSAGVTEQGYYYEAHAMRLAEHGGTHIDAPIHFHANRQHVDEIPLDQLIGEGVVVDVIAPSAADRDYRVGVADFEQWEKQHGRIPDQAIVLLRTGFGRYWSDRAQYMGTAERGPDAVAKLHFPGLHPDAARWLITQRKIKAVGLDTPSIDHGPSKDFAAHIVLCNANVPAFENVAHLDRLPPRGFEIIALPMKIRGGSGGPTRIIAVFRDA